MVDVIAWKAKEVLSTQVKSVAYKAGLSDEPVPEKKKKKSKDDKKVEKTRDRLNVKMEERREKREQAHEDEVEQLREQYGITAHAKLEVPSQRKSILSRCPCKCTIC